MLISESNPSRGSDEGMDPRETNGYCGVFAEKSSVCAAVDPTGSGRRRMFLFWLRREKSRARSARVAELVDAPS